MSRGMTARQRWTALWSSRRSGGRLSSAAGGSRGCGRVLRGRVCCRLLCRKNLWGTWNVQNGWIILSFYTQICNLCSLPGNIIFVILGPTKYLSDNFVVQACTDDFKVKCMGRDYIVFYNGNLVRNLVLYLVAVVVMWVVLVVLVVVAAVIVVVNSMINYSVVSVHWFSWLAFVNVSL